MKKVDWSQNYRTPVPDITKGKGSNSKYRSMKEAFEDHHQKLAEQRKAQETLSKAMPLMKDLLLSRMVNKTPLKVMRPLHYTSEALGGQDEEEDDGFYAIRKSDQQLPEFQNVTKVIAPGTELTFIQLEKSLNQLWFKTQEGKEVGIYVDEQNRLLTQTDIFETISKALEGND